MGWEPLHAQSCKYAEGQVKGANEHASRQSSGPPGWYGKFRNHPGGAGCQMGPQPTDKVPDVFLRKAIEEEVCRDKVI